MAIDDAVRLSIRHSLDDTLFVEAGAGTGKTTQLVARILQLIRTGTARIDQIAAITFTEAAAAELRDRLASALDRLDAVALGEEDPDGEVMTEEVRSNARDALVGLDGAAISTLHGFARRVLSEHSFEAGLPPVIEVLDEIRSQVEFEERWTTFLDELLLDDESGRSVLLVMTCDVTLENLKAVAKKLNDNWDLLTAPPASGPPPRVRVEAAAVLDSLRTAVELRRHCVSDDDLLFQHLEELVAYIAKLEASVDDIETLRTLVSRKLKVRGGKGPDWNGYKPQIVELLDEAEAARCETVDAIFRAALDHLLARISAQTLQAAAWRQAEGRLQFHDLLVLARDLTRHSSNARAALHEAYPFLLIDEFQDTDPIQAELAFRIASSEVDPGYKPWSELAVEPGRLFFVGDPKQSIYRFRRADIGLFLTTRQLVGPDALQLTTSFRSAPGVVAWFNHVFAALMDGSSGEQPDYVPLAVHTERSWAEAPCGARVLYFGAEAEAGVNMPEIRHEEVYDLARVIEQVRDEKWPIGPDAQPARLSDITVLIPTRTALPSLQAALDEHQIPYRLESSSLVYSAQEVRDLLHVTAAVDDPTNEVAIVAALRSPGFGCGDDDLLGFSLAKGSWDYRLSAPLELDATHPVVRGLADLRALHEQSWHMEVSAMLEEIVASRRFLDLALYGPRYRESWRRLRFVCDQARQFTDSTGSDLRRYLAWVELQCDEDARVTEVVLPESDVDAVRIMTVHAAKGLEFPIVMLAGLGVVPSHSDGVDVLFTTTGYEVRIKDRHTDGYPDLALVERRMEQAERVRLLYVAATRASDYLVVSLHRKAGPKNKSEKTITPLAELLDAVSAQCGDLVFRWRRDDTAPSPSVPAVKAAELEEPLPDSDAARTEWIEERRALLEQAKTPGTLSATAVVRLAREVSMGDGSVDGLEHAPMSDDREEEGESSRRDQPAWRKGRAGTAIGRAVHATLQSIDLATGDGLHELASAQAIAEGVPHRLADIEAMVRAALASSDVQRALIGRYWREIYVGAPVAGRVLEGFVDLLLEGPDGLEVVDYKTNQVESESDLDALMTANRIQGAAYAVAVEAAVGRPVTSCRFLFLNANGSVSRSVVDLEGAKRDVRNLLRFS